MYIKVWPKYWYKAQNSSQMHDLYVIYNSYVVKSIFLHYWDRTNFKESTSFRHCVNLTNPMVLFVVLDVNI